MPKNKITASVVFEDSTVHFYLKDDGQPQKVLPLLFEIANGLISSGRWDGVKYNDPVLLYLFTNSDGTISTKYNVKSGIGKFNIGDSLNGDEDFVYEVRKTSAKKGSDSIANVVIYKPQHTFEPGKFKDRFVDSLNQEISQTVYFEDLPLIDAFNLQ